MNQPISFSVGPDGTLRIVAGAVGTDGNTSMNANNQAAPAPAGGSSSPSAPEPSAGNQAPPNPNQGENPSQIANQQSNASDSTQQLPVINAAQLQSLAAVNPLLLSSPAFIQQLVNSANLTGGPAAPPSVQAPLPVPAVPNMQQQLGGMPTFNNNGFMILPQQANVQQQQQQQQVYSANPVQGLPIMIQQPQMPFIQPWLQASFQQVLAQGQQGIGFVPPMLNPTVASGGQSAIASSDPSNASAANLGVYMQAENQAFPCYGRTVPLYNDMDEETLSEYQCIARKQIEIFEATQEDLDSSAQGRNKPICVGQVGIRCRHCGHLPRKRRAKGAVYFPSQLSGLYQTAQNMANSHFIKGESSMPKCSIFHRMVP
jgi:hypothetical protein